MRRPCGSQAGWGLAPAFLFFFSHATALDGPLPYGPNANAPDVISYDQAWNTSYPVFEGYTPPILEDTEAAVYSTDNPDSDPGAADLGRRADNDFFLRVMPLGASITQGYQSTDGNGYRQWLRSKLRFEGWKVNNVGSKKDGSMADRDNEGHPGFVIDQVHNEFRKSMWMKPNLVLINAGTNDCADPNIDVGGAGGRIRSMVDDIYGNIPGVTVILSTIVKSTDAAKQACAEDISQQIRDLVLSYRGQRIGLADIQVAMPATMLNADGIHPTDAGYKLFAAVWWDAIRKVQAQIQPPATVSGIDDASASHKADCRKVAGAARGPIQSQVGSGHDDGNYQHSSEAKGVLSTARIDKGQDPKSITDATPAHIFFANLVLVDPNAAALDDWIRVYHNQQGKNAYWFRQNLGGGKFGASVSFDVDMNCDSGPRYAFADFNNDGLADFFCLQQGSAVSVSLNLGGNPPKFKSLGQVVPTHDGFNVEDVRIGDIDGDGRADYCLVKSDGVVICSRNGGYADKYFWQGFTTEDGLRGVVFDKNNANRNGVVLADLNGDFRDDYLWIGDNGSVDTWINNRGWGTGIVPDWRGAGRTHLGQATSGVQDRIKFGRIYGSGRRDYIYLEEDNTGFDVVVWENKGAGGTKRKGDGNFYCDMRGTGSDDYVWIYMDGHADEINTNIHHLPSWGHDVKIELTVPGPRSGIHLADWTGNGRCDVLVQNKGTGALTLYENQWDAGARRLTFANRGVVTPATCNQGWGVGIFDRGMRVADIDGDGRADVICLEPDGRITAWLNLQSGMTNVGQIKFSEGWDRANIRFADVEGSGRADIIWLNKYTGAGTVFENKGRQATSGSSFSWSNRGVLYAPIDRGETMHFTNQGGLGRADLLHVLPLTNRAWTYFNECGDSGGDDGNISDPGLPSYNTGGGDNGGGNGGGNDGDGGAGGGGGGDQCTSEFEPGSRMALHENFFDPSLVFNPDDCSWYSFASYGNGKAIQVAVKTPSSKDWKRLDDADPLPNPGPWIGHLEVISPDVQRIGNKWVMYYAAKNRNGEGRCVGAATSDKMTGPYEPRQDPISCYDDEGGSIDPSGFYDPRSNTRWIVFKIDGSRKGCGATPIVLQQVEDDGVTPRGDRITLLDQTDTEENSIEAPNLVYQDGRYLLFFSPDCWTTEDYSVSYATSDSVTGPYTRASDPVISTIAGSLKGPGSASSNGKGHMVFSAWCDPDSTTRCMFETDYTFKDGQVTLGA